MDNAFKFVVKLPTINDDPNGFYKKGLVDVIMKYPGLTVSGIDKPDVKRGIQYAGPGKLITVGTAKTHDIEWVEREDYAREKGYKPVYELIKDWNRVVAGIDAYAKEKARLQRLEAARKSLYTNYYGNTIVIGGVKMQVFDNFIKVGTLIIPRELTTSNAHILNRLDRNVYLTIATSIYA